MDYWGHILMFCSDSLRISRENVLIKKLIFMQDTRLLVTFSNDGFRRRIGENVLIK